MVEATISAIKDGRTGNLKHSVELPEAGIPRFKRGYLTAPATTDDTNTILVDLYKEFGIHKLLGIQGYIHTTTDSVIVEEAPTTTVDREILTITVGGSTDNKKRFYEIYGI